MRVMGWRSKTAPSLPADSLEQRTLGWNQMTMQCFICCGLVQKGAPPCRWDSVEPWWVGFSFRSGADLVVGCGVTKPSSPTAQLFLLFVGKLQRSSTPSSMVGLATPSRWTGGRWG